MSADAVGRCPNCGIVTGDELDYRFPNPCECNRCGSQLEKTMIASAEVIAEHV